MRQRWNKAVASAVLIGLSPMLAAQQLFGYLESVTLQPGGLPLEAKLDTGADHSSLHASQIRQQNSAQGPQVRFRLHTSDGNSREFALPLLRIASIRRHSGQIEQRPVVRLQFCLGDQIYESETNLVDRSGFSVPLLIGRSLLQQGIVVDPARQHTRAPQCTPN